MFDKAVGKLIAVNPFKFADVIEHEEEIRRPLTKREQRLVYKYLETNPYYELHFWLYLKTGMRKSEIQKFDVLYGEKLIHIKGTKTKSSNRYVPLLPELETKLKVFYSAGRTFNTNLRNISRAFDSMCEKLKIEDVCIHSLRHTFATRCWEKKMPVEDISALLGHKSVAITFRYIHRLLEFQKQNAKNIGKKMLKLGM